MPTTSDLNKLYQTPEGREAAIEAIYEYYGINLVANAVESPEKLIVGFIQATAAIYEDTGAPINFKRTLLHYIAEFLYHRAILEYSGKKDPIPGFSGLNIFHTWYFWKNVRLPREIGYDGRTYRLAILFVGQMVDMFYADTEGAKLSVPDTTQTGRGVEMTLVQGSGTSQYRAAKELLAKLGKVGVFFKN